MSEPKVTVEEIYAFIDTVRAQRPWDDRYPFAVISTAAGCVALDLGYTPEQFEKAMGILSRWYRERYAEKLS